MNAIQSDESPPSRINASFDLERPRSSGSARRTAGTARVAGSATPCSKPPIWSRVSGCSTSAAGGQHDDRGRPAGGAYRRRGRRRHLRPGARARERAVASGLDGVGLHRGGCPSTSIRVRGLRCRDQPVRDDVLRRSSGCVRKPPTRAAAGRATGHRPGRVRSRASGRPSPSTWRSPSSGDRLTSARRAGRARSRSRTATDSERARHRRWVQDVTLAALTRPMLMGSDVEDVVGMVAATPQSKASLPVSPRPRSGQRSRRMECLCSVRSSRGCRDERDCLVVDGPPLIPWTNPGVNGDDPTKKG